MDGKDGSKWEHTRELTERRERFGNTQEDVGGSHGPTYEKRWEETGAGGQMSRSVGVGGEEEGRWRSSRRGKNMEDDIRYGFNFIMGAKFKR